MNQEQAVKEREEWEKQMKGMAKELDEVASLAAKNGADAIRAEYRLDKIRDEVKDWRSKCGKHVLEDILDRVVFLSRKESPNV